MLLLLALMRKRKRRSFGKRYVQKGNGLFLVKSGGTNLNLSYIISSDGTWKQECSPRYLLTNNVNGTSFPLSPVRARARTPLSDRAYDEPGGLGKVLRAGRSAGGRRASSVRLIIPCCSRGIPMGLPFYARAWSVCRQTARPRVSVNGGGGAGGGVE